MEQKWRTNHENPLFRLAAITALLLAMATATYAKENTLEFVEQAIFVDAWDTLSWLGEEYGVFTVGCECYGGVYGDLSVGGFAATKNTTVFVDEALGKPCTLTFEADAYDAVRAELVKRYGDPLTKTDADPTLTWTFEWAEIRLVPSNDGEFALIYTTLDSPVLSKPTFPPPQAAPPAPTRKPQAAELSQESTFAFMEQASMAASWEDLLGLMRQYGLQGLATGCYADIIGDLSIGGASAKVVMILCRDHEDETVYETAGYDYDIWFESEDYDAVKDALVKRYGEPRILDDSHAELCWSFQQTEVRFCRHSLDNAVLTYY